MRRKPGDNDFLGATKERITAVIALHWKQLSSESYIIKNDKIQNTYISRSQSFHQISEGFPS